MSYKACIFDLDGTLADTVESMAYIANKMLGEYGLPAQPEEKFKYFSGEGSDMLVKRCLTAAGDGELVHLEEGKKRYRELFEQDPLYKVEPYEGIIQMLKELKKNQIKTAVCSNKPHEAAVKVIKSLFGEELFSMVLGQQPKIARKPDPQGPLKIAADFQVSPSECVYVGDTRTDMETGHRAGMFTVGVLWGFRGLEELKKYKADRIISDPLELLELFEE